MSDETASREQQQAGWFERLDRHVYAFENAVVTASLLVMALTYFLKILQRQLRSETNSFDDMFIRWAGFDSTGAARRLDPELVDTITGVVTPVVLGVLAWLLAVMALRTRWQLGKKRELGEESDAPLPSPPYRRFMLLGLLSVPVLWGGLELLAAIPSRYTCFAGIGVLLAVGGYHAIRSRSWGSLVGTLTAALIIGSFFYSEADVKYNWASKLSIMLLMYVGFLGASMATRDGKHLKIEAVTKLVPPRFKHLHSAVGGAATLLFLVFLCALAVYETIHHGEAWALVEGTDYPYFLVTLPIALALVLMIVRFSVHVGRDFAAHRRGEIPEQKGPELH